VTVGSNGIPSSRTGEVEHSLQCHLWPWRLRGVFEVAVAFSGTAVAFVALWQKKRHGRKPYSIRIRAFVAFVALFFDLDLAIKKKMDDTLHPRSTIFLPDRGSRKTPQTPRIASKPYGIRVSAVALCKLKTPRIQPKTPRQTRKRHGWPCRHLQPTDAIDGIPSPHPAADNLDPIPSHCTTAAGQSSCRHKLKPYL